MDVINYLSAIAGNAELGLLRAITPVNLFYCAIGVTVGTLLGALPGLGTFIAMALLFPLTFHLEPTTGLIMLAGIYYGTSYGGSIASILLNIRAKRKARSPASTAYPMARQGRAGIALSMTAVASFIGGSIGIILMMLFSPLIAQVALKFGPSQFFALMLLGLVISSSAASDKPMNGYAMVAFGIALGLVGTDLEIQCAALYVRHSRHLGRPEPHRARDRIVRRHGSDRDDARPAERHGGSQIA